jgi:hypothetical protein
MGKWDGNVRSCGRSSQLWEGDLLITLFSVSRWGRQSATMTEGTAAVASPTADAWSLHPNGLPLGMGRALHCDERRANRYGE